MNPSLESENLTRKSGGGGKFTMGKAGDEWQDWPQDCKSQSA